jgi:NADPH:quinone reductase-like Zn-dependent oxidoreductase
MATLTTRAILIERHGGPEVLTEKEIPLPAPGSGEVLLAVEAAGVNFADLLMRTRVYQPLPPRPFSPGLEVAGRVTQVGSDVRDWQEGDRAVAILPHGGYRHDVVTSASRLYPYPTSLTPVQAAAVPLVFLTAWVCLFETGHAHPADVLLVLGAGGGVGTAAVQLAVAHGLRVVGTAGDARKRAFVVDELGAEACFDSRTDWEPEVCGLLGPERVDIALDPVGGKATAACNRLLAPLGRIVFYGFSSAMPKSKASLIQAAMAWMRTPRFHPLSLVPRNLGVHGMALFGLGHKEPLLRSALDSVFRDMVDGRMRPVIDRVLPFDRTGAVQAHTHLHARQNLGKVVLSDSA